MVRLFEITRKKDLNHFVLLSLKKIDRTDTEIAGRKDG